MDKSRKQAVETTKQRHGDDFHSRIAREANKAWDANGRKPRGFAAMKLNNPERLKRISLEAARKKQPTKGE